MEDFLKPAKNWLSQDSTKAGAATVFAALGMFFGFDFEVSEVFSNLRYAVEGLSVTVAAVAGLYEMVRDEITE